MSRKVWITVAITTLALGGVVAGATAVAAELRMETTQGRVVPGGAIVGERGVSANTTGGVDGGGVGVNPGQPAPVTPPVADTPVVVAPLPPAVAPSTGDDDDDDGYGDDDGDDGGDGDDSGDD